MKKFLYELGLIITIIIFLPLALIMCICYLLFVPIDIILYHRTPYYKDFKIKYCFFITSKDVVRLYNYIVQKQLPFEYVKQNDYEYFIKDGEVLLCGWSDYAFEETEGNWYFILDGEGGEMKELVQDNINYDKDLLKLEHQSLPAKYLMFYDDITDAELFEKRRNVLIFTVYFQLMKLIDETCILYNAREIT